MPAEKPPEGPDVDAAYALRSPEDVLRLYRDWAATYDTVWAAEMQFALPVHVAEAFLAAGGTGPVLDVGAGTGLLGQALRDRGFAGRLDGIDLTPEMLERARAKGIYDDLVTADVTRPLPVAGPYAGFVSSGVFTHGHVGPEALDRLMTVAAPGAVFLLAINPVLYRTAGFETTLAAFGARIGAVTLTPVAIYGAAAAAKDPAHAADHSQLVHFRKA